MTRETRVDVFDQIKSVGDLQIGDRIVFKAKRGADMRMNSSFTYGGIKDGVLLTKDGFTAASHTVFGNTISGWHSTEWHVWRELPKLPTEVGSIVYIHELTKSNKMSHYVAEGLAVLRGAGSWEFILNPEVKFGAANVAEWSEVNIETTN